jgi:hypothetical protein
MLKVKYFELNPSSGHYGYRSHNFNVIPEKIKALGQKIQTDCTSNALTIHIAKDKSTDITTISVVQRSHCSNNSGKVKGFPCLLVPC